jgi:hypothetical protein
MRSFVYCQMIMAGNAISEQAPDCPLRRIGFQACWQSLACSTVDIALRLLPPPFKPYGEGRCIPYPSLLVE